MARDKITDESEVKRWYEEGRTYKWMAEEYGRRGIQIGPSAFSERRHARGWERRKVRDTNLIPWAVREEHRWDNLLAQLRTEAKVRAGKDPAELSEPVRRRWMEFRHELEETNSVVYYDPETEQGFFLVPRLASDTDIIRRPRGRGPRGRGRRD